MRPPQDLSSLSHPEEICVKHIDWKVQVDFVSQTIKGQATYTLDYVTPTATVVHLDTAHLTVTKVTGPDGTALKYTLSPLNTSKPHLGRQLSITCDKLTQVTVHYSTTAQSSALQWLPKEQTAGRQYPYLFTQCQAIHARSLLPCQDRPGVKATYTAQVTVPSWATCVMSALLQGVQDGNTSATKDYTWNQPVAVSSYLIAMAVGELAKVDISKRCAVWSEPSLVDQSAYEFAQTEDFLQIAEKLAGKPYQWGRYDLLCLPPSFPYGGMENPCLTFVTPTLLAGDRSLADVVAHEIAHSWTGNLVTNATWDHFWLNEGWTTWFQRKIMARIHKNPSFFDFDAIGGYQHLQDEIQNEMPAEFTKLVLDIGDRDPDESYSVVAYEKGCNLLIALERRVGTKAFEAFFQAYVDKFASKTVTSEEFRDFFNQHFSGQKDKINDIDWESWFYKPGMPPEAPKFDRTLAEASEKLTKRWLDVDRSGKMVPSEKLTSWSSDQICCFLDGLLDATAGQPLKVDTLKAMKQQYGFEATKNSEVLFRFCRLALAAEDESITPVVVRFVTSQGRMKFTRPLYKALYRSKMGKELAVKTFLEHKDFYHPICSKMVASDLWVAPRKKKAWLENRLVWMGVAAVAVVAGFVLLRRKR